MTIDKLMRADVRFFMLTGDKLETAIEIAKSCQLIQPDMKVIVIKKSKEDVFRKLSKLIHKKAINPNSKVESLKGVDLFK